MYVDVARQPPRLPLAAHQAFLDVITTLVAQYVLTLVHTVAPLPRSALAGDRAPKPRSSNAEWLEALVGEDTAGWILSKGGGGGGDEEGPTPAAAASPASSELEAQGLEPLCVRLASAEWSAKQLHALSSRLQAELPEPTLALTLILTLTTNSNH